jgi:hypothetical protein
MARPYRHPCDPESKLEFLFQNKTGAMLTQRARHFIGVPLFLYFL